MYGNMEMPVVSKINKDNRLDALLISCQHEQEPNHLNFWIFFLSVFESGKWKVFPLFF